MKAVLMAFVMTIRASSDIWVPRCFPLKHITAFGRYDGSTPPCASVVVVSAETDRYRFCYILLQESRPSRRDRKRWRLWQQRCLDVDWRLPHVGVVDETRRTYRHHGRQRDAPRRIATFRHATQRVAPHRYATLEPLGKPGGSRAFSADGSHSSACGSKSVM
jgi:hypothetical protein